MTTSLFRLRRTIERRIRWHDGDDGVAMVSVILFMIMLSGMSLVLLGVILGQMGPAYAAQKSTKTIYSAQAGLQSALGAVRSATKIVSGGAIVGDITKLPCDIKAKVDGEADAVAYQVKVGYYLANPDGKSEAWLASAANKMTCTNGSGVSVQPNYAYVVSSGTGESAAGRDAKESNRSVAAVYKFKVSNVNIPGSRIFDFDRNVCLQAEDTTAGSEIRFVSMANCNSNPDRQLWVYTPTWQIKLASSIVTAGSAGVCIAKPTSGNDRAVLQPCLTANGSDKSRQLWGWNGSSGWDGRNSSNTGNQGCLARDGDRLEVDAPCSKFSPEPAVGAGAASYSTKQVVNYTEFGRCLDVTDTDIYKSFMISYPCKQDPSGSGAFDWNHKWFYTEPDTASGQTTLGDQRIIVYRNNTTNSSNTFCLTTPTTGGKYPRFELCSVGGDRQRWTRVYNTGDYAASYLFTDTEGRCLAADPTDKYLVNWSRIIVAACNGSEVQKWNAPASYNDATFGSFKETDGYKELG